MAQPKSTSSFYKFVRLSLIFVLVIITTFLFLPKNALAQEKNPDECFALDLLVAEGKGTLDAITPQNCEGGYQAGTLVDIMAMPAEGFVLESWEGTDDQSGGNIGQVLMYADRLASVEFVSIPSDVSAAAACPSSFEGYDQMGTLYPVVYPPRMADPRGAFFRDSWNGWFGTTAPDSNSIYPYGHVMSPDGYSEFVDVLYYISNDKSYNSSTFTVKLCSDGQAFGWGDNIQM